MSAFIQCFMPSLSLVMTLNLAQRSKGLRQGRCFMSDGFLETVVQNSAF